MRHSWKVMLTEWGDFSSDASRAGKVGARPDLKGRERKGWPWELT